MKRSSVAIARTLGTLLSMGALGAAPLLAPTSALAQRRPEARELELTVGETHVIRNDGSSSFDPGNEQIAGIGYDEATDNYVVRARSAGESTLTLLYEDGRETRYHIVVRGRVQAAAGMEVVARDDIRLDLYFVELRESSGHQLGLAWPTSLPPSRSAIGADVSIDLVTSTLTRATASITEALLPRLDIAQASGWARLLRQAVLVTVNGETASIDAGGEVNILVNSGFQAQLRRIQYGTIIEMTPRYDPNSGRIEVQISADVSDLTPPSTAGSTVPGRTRTAVQTLVNLELGQSIALGGLTSRSTTQSQNGIAGLSQIPILGVLFGTNTRRDEAQENFVFIVPTVTQAVGRAQQDRIREALRVYESFGSIGASGLGDIELVEPSPPGYQE